MLCSSSRRWAVRPLSHPNRMNKILLLFFRPQRLSFSSSSSSSSSSRTNIILKSQSESKTHINTIIMEDEVSKQQQKQATRGSMEFLSSKPYVPPQWASHLNPIPSHIFSLAHVNKTLNSLLLELYWISELFSIFIFVPFSFPLQFTNGTFLICRTTPRSG